VKFQQEWAYAATSLGGLALRRHDWSAAETYFRGALKPLDFLAHDHPTIPGVAENACGGRLNLAQALEPEGKSAEALAEYRQARELAEKIPRLRQTTEDLLRACERRTKLESQLAAFLRGEARPADAGELLDVAALCQTRKMLYAAAARFYEQAFQSQPALAADMQRQHRYNAACAAALAGSGQGKDGSTLSEDERVRWRNQALDWLRADLAFWTKQVENGPPKARGLVLQTLRHWQGDSDLAGVRESVEVAKLPEKERERCRQFWSEVDALLARARGGK
jgi:serine/threonine-protein kinase